VGVQRMMRYKYLPDDKAAGNFVCTGLHCRGTPIAPFTRERVGPGQSRAFLRSNLVQKKMTRHFIRREIFIGLFVKIRHTGFGMPVFKNSPGNPGETSFICTNISWRGVLCGGFA